MISLGITEEDTPQEEQLKARVTDFFILLPSAGEQQGWNACGDQTLTNRHNNHMVQDSYCFWISCVLKNILKLSLNKTNKQANQKTTSELSFLCILGYF